MDLVPILLQRIETTAELIANVKPERLGDPTPCEGFDVRGLLNHFIGGQLGMARAIAGEGSLDPNETPPDLVGRAGDDPAKAVADLVEATRAAWAAPGAMDQENTPVGRGMPAKMALRIALVEAVVHGWDIARATDQSYEIPDMLAQPMLDGLRKAFGDAPRTPEPGAFFGPPVELPEDAPIADKLVAFTGRTP